MCPILSDKVELEEHVITRCLAYNVPKDISTHICTDNHFYQTVKKPKPARGGPRRTFVYNMVNMTFILKLHQLKHKEYNLNV